MLLCRQSRHTHTDSLGGPFCCRARASGTDQKATTPTTNGRTLLLLKPRFIIFCACDEMEETNAKCNAMPKQKEEERWEDLEPLLQSCASAMRSGELMHQKSFGLFEAMSAVEIMDPKMDAGCGGMSRGGVRDDKTTTKKRPMVPDVAALAPEEMKTIADMLVARENSWHVGNALPPTVFSCLYLKEDELRKLSAFASSSASSWPTKAFETLMTTTLPFVGLIKKMVEIGDVFEEEDFNPHDYGLKVPSPEWMQRKESNETNVATDILEEDACAVKYEEVLKQGKDTFEDSELYRRLVLRFALYRAFKRIADVPTEENGKKIKKDFKEARATAKRILEEEDLGNSTYSGSNSNNSDGDGGTKGQVEGEHDNDNDDAHPVFDASAFAHALGNSPPRVVELFTVKQSYEYYLKLLDELEVIVERLYDSVATTMTHSELSSDDFFRKCRDITDRDFLALSRSVAAYVSTVGGSTDSHLSIASVDLCLRSVFAQFPDKAKLNDSAQQLSAFKREPFEYVSSEIKKGNYNAVTVTCEETGGQTDGDPMEILATFKDECQRTCSFLARAYFAAPARRRRKLHRCLDELSHLQVSCSHMDALGVASLFLNQNINEGNDIDADKTHEFCARAFQLWASRVVANAQFDILKVGFQCELYKNYELASVYWYMDNLLLHVLNTDRYIADAFNNNAEEVTDQSKDTYREAQIFRSRSNAAQCVLAALEKLGLIKMPKHTFTLATAEARFFQRFAHFQANVDPVPLFWDDYEMHVRDHEKYPVGILLRLAHGHLQPVTEYLSNQIESLQKNADSADALRAKRIASLTFAKAKCARLSATCKLLSALPEDGLRAMWTVDVIQPFSSSSSPSSSSLPSSKNEEKDDVFFALSASRAK